MKFRQIHPAPLQTLLCVLSSKTLIHAKNHLSWGWREGSVVKSMSCSYRRPKFSWAAMAHAFNRSTQELEAGGSLEFEDSLPQKNQTKQTNPGDSSWLPRRSPGQALITMAPGDLLPSFSFRAHTLIHVSVCKHPHTRKFFKKIYIKETFVPLPPPLIFVQETFCCTLPSKFWQQAQLLWILRRS